MGFRLIYKYSFVNSIEQAANYTPNDTIITLLNKMEVLVKNYHVLEVPKKVKLTASFAAPAKFKFLLLR